MERRNQQLDIVKGFAIVFVVLGHAIQFTYKDFDNIFIFRLIYSFHMPLFMFVSGILVQFNRNKTIDLCWLKKKFENLIVPFTVWPCLVSAVKGGTIVEIGKNVLYTYLMPTSGGLWFLYILFLCHFILFISNFIKEKIHKKSELILIVLILFVYILHYVIGVDYLGMNELPWFILFYFSGHFIGQKRDITKIPTQRKEYVLFFIMCFFLALLFPYWRRTEITPLLSNIEANSLVISFANLFFKYLVALCGVGIIMFVSKVVINLKLFSLALEILGRHTIDIYILHLTSFNLIITKNSILNIIIKTVLGISSSLLIGYIVRSGIMERCLFGTSSLNKSVNNGGN